jgi:predicted RNA-binding protein with PUA-like domain
VDVRFVRKLKRVITLDEIKTLPDLGDFALTRRGNRLSVLPVGDRQWHAILALE